MAVPDMGRVSEVPMLAAIVGILLGNLLIGTLFAPSFMQLRMILGKLARVRIPYKDPWGPLTTQAGDEAERRAAVDKAMSEFNLRFREYSIAFESFKQLGYVFLLAIILLLSVTVWQSGLTMRSSFLAVVGMVMLLIILISVYVQRRLAPTPWDLVSVDFLANNLPNLHLETLFDTAMFHVNTGFNLQDPSDPMLRFRLITKAIIWDYKVLFAVTDRDCSRLHLLTYGCFGRHATLEHIWRPGEAFFAVPLGELDFQRVSQVSADLWVHLWLFIPTPLGWAKSGPDRPRFKSEQVSWPQRQISIESAYCV